MRKERAHDRLVLGRHRHAMRRRALAPAVGERGLLVGRAGRRFARRWPRTAGRAMHAGAETEGEATAGRVLGDAGCAEDVGRRARTGTGRALARRRGLRLIGSGQVAGIGMAVAVLSLAPATPPGRRWVVPTASRRLSLAGSRPGDLH